jgi:IS30 family transposase
MKIPRSRWRRLAAAAITGALMLLVRDAIAATIARLPGHLRRSLTWDQGAEMAQDAQLRIDTGLSGWSWSGSRPCCWAPC